MRLFRKRRAEASPYPPTLQLYRVWQAMIEARPGLAVPGSVANALRGDPLVGDRLRWSTTAAPPRSLEPRIDHATPRTRVGAYQQPIIAPRLIVDHLRERWPVEREAHAVFCGLLTPQREELFASHGLLANGRVRVVASTRGREWPGKAWDAEYFDALLGARFALCPPGDHAWSYRFIESTLCGAIPVVFCDHPIQSSFAVLAPHELAAGRYDADVAEKNRALAEERFGADPQRLGAAIDAALGP
ncbi:exostosin family protein [Botrimarina sp.]|uniref:exostosin domain-containing protein n=1 Tax=Botrimarina sp. TaxID=2795802 RepID=UPI0032EBBC96